MNKNITIRSLLLAAMAIATVACMKYDNSLSDDKPFPMNLLTGHPWSKDLLLGSEWQGILDFADKAQRLVWENYLKG